MKLFNPRNIASFLCTLLLLSWKPAGNSEARHVDLVFCLDLSASTNGILNDVRQRMWNIANGILHENENTELRIAVVGYGRPSFGETDGFVKVISELTNEFDRASYDMFQLKARIEKGDQFVPNALHETRRQLKWSKNLKAEKIVFLMGNGSVYTGSINLADVCDEYKKDNIKINTVFVAYSNRIMSQAAGYKKIADQTNGKFYIMTPAPDYGINKTTVVSPVAYSLNDSLNSTFMFYSKDAAERKKYLFETDKNIFKSGTGYFYSRLLYKTSMHYIENYESYDLTAFITKHNKMPDYLNLDFLNKAEKTMNVSEIEKRAREKAAMRLRLNEEIKNIFISETSTSQADTLLDNFVLENYK
jgi:hypothetical protein